MLQHGSTHFESLTTPSLSFARYKSWDGLQSEGIQHFFSVLCPREGSFMETISDNESDTSAIDVSTPGKSSFPSVPSKLNECSLSISSQDPGRCCESSHVHASGYVRSKCSPERSVASKGGVRRHSLATESASGRSSPPPSEPDCDSDADDGQKEHAFLQFERGPPRSQPSPRTSTRQPSAPRSCY